MTLILLTRQLHYRISTTFLKGKLNIKGLRKNFKKGGGLNGGFTEKSWGPILGIGSKCGKETLPNETIFLMLNVVGNVLNRYINEKMYTMYPVRQKY